MDGSQWKGFYTNVFKMIELSSAQADSVSKEHSIRKKRMLTINEKDSEVCREREYHKRNFTWTEEDAKFLKNLNNRDYYTMEQIEKQEGYGTGNATKHRAQKELSIGGEDTTEQQQKQHFDLVKTQQKKQIDISRWKMCEADALDGRYPFCSTCILKAVKSGRENHSKSQTAKDLFQKDPNWHDNRNVPLEMFHTNETSNQSVCSQNKLDEIEQR